jgi:hypothetical protein
VRLGLTVKYHRAIAVVLIEIFRRICTSLTKAGLLSAPMAEAAPKAFRCFAIACAFADVAGGCGHNGFARRRAPGIVQAHDRNDDPLVNVPAATRCNKLAATACLILD